MGPVERMVRHHCINTCRPLVLNTRSSLRLVIWLYFLVRRGDSSSLYIISGSCLRQEQAKYRSSLQTSTTVYQCDLFERTMLDFRVISVSSLLCLLSGLIHLAAYAPFGKAVAKTEFASFSCRDGKSSDSAVPISLRKKSVVFLSWAIIEFH